MEKLILFVMSILTFDFNYWAHWITWHMFQIAGLIFEWIWPIVALYVGYLILQQSIIWFFTRKGE